METKFIKKINLEKIQQRKRDLVNIESNVNQSTVKGNLKIKLSSLLLKLQKSSNIEVSGVSGFSSILIETNSMRKVNFQIPTANLSKFFNPQTFNANYFLAFQENFPTQVSSTLFFGLNIYIENDISNQTSSTLEIGDLKSFKFLVCILFGLLFSIKLDHCFCYPQNQSELNAINSGIGMNCISLQCKNYLLQYPTSFDNLVHSDCPLYGVQAIFSSITAFAGGNITFKNMNINQTFDCIHKNSDVN